MASVRPWPTIADEDQWVIELMEERFQKTPLSPEQLQARATELRAEAERADWKGTRDAAMAIAERYEQMAAARAPAP